MTSARSWPPGAPSRCGSSWPDRITCRIAELDGPLTPVAHILTAGHRASAGPAVSSHCRVEVVENRVVVDVHHTSTTSFATGIQRVAREVVGRWERAHDLLLVGWTPGYLALRPLPPSAIDGVRPDAGAEAEEESDTYRGDIVVPWRCTYVLPELLAEPGRVDRFHTLARSSGNHTAAIGFDCVPLTTGETVIEGMGADFAHYLSAVAQVDRVATISDAAAAEFRGWRSMLQGAGISGPEITAIPLPVDRPPLWRDGLNFSVLFIEGNSWNEERFTASLHRLQAAGRPVHAVSAPTDDLLWAAYHVARCTLFPSLNEGFGLPVAESLASGTPVITSNFGSMREIAEPGGALLVDPRDDHDIARALTRLLTDDDLHAELVRQARERPRRTWEQYADETWGYLVTTLRAAPR